MNIVKSKLIFDNFDNFLLEKILIGEPVTIPELRQVLNNKILNFEFIKLDGEVRPARGTTMLKYIPKGDQPTGLNEPTSDKVAAFYDLSKNSWRSVSNRSKEVVIRVDKETGKPKVVISDKKPKEKSATPIKKDDNGNIIPPPRPLLEPSKTIVRPSILPTVMPVTPPISDFDNIDNDEKDFIDITDSNVVAANVTDDQINYNEEPEEIDDVNQFPETDDEIEFSDEEPEDDIIFPEDDDEEEIIDYL